MATAPDWLDEVVVLNESKDETISGDISVYRSEGDAFRDIEAWWVESAEGFAFTATGMRLALGVGPSGEVIVIRREECSEGPAIVLGWLRVLAQTTLESFSRSAF